MIRHEPVSAHRFLGDLRKLAQVSIAAFAMASCTAVARPGSSATSPPVAPGPTVTSRPTSPPATASAIPGTDSPFAVTGTPSADCQDGPDHLGRWPLPSPESLQWVDTNLAQGGRVQRLAGVSAPLDILDASPDGRWALVTLRDSCEGQGKSLDCRYKSYVIDTLGQEHWIPKVGPNDSLQTWDTHAWLTDGRLLWVGDGRVYLAEPGGVHIRDLTGPDEAHLVWLGRDNIALIAAESGGWWRLAVDSGAWEEVPEVQHFLADHASVGLAPDGSFAAIDNRAGSLWQVPLSLGEPVRSITCQGHRCGGGGIAPQPLAGSPLWLMFARVDDEPGSRFVLIDSRDGRLIPLEEALGQPIVPGDDPYVLPRLVGEGRWLVAFTDVEGTFPETAPWMYVAPAANLRDGRLLEGYHFILDSAAHPPSLVLMPLTTEGFSVVQLIPETMESRLLMEGDFDDSYPGPPEIEALPDAYVLQWQDFAEPRLQYPVDIWSHQGERLARLDVPLYANLLHWVALSPDRLLIDLTPYTFDATGQCRYEEMLLQWDLSAVIP